MPKFIKSVNDVDRISHDEKAEKRIDENKSHGNYFASVNSDLAKAFTIPA